MSPDLPEGTIKTCQKYYLAMGRSGSRSPFDYVIIEAVTSTASSQVEALPCKAECCLRQESSGSSGHVLLLLSMYELSNI